VGLSIQLRDERQNIEKEIFDEQNLLHSILPIDDWKNSPLISSIDLYGDTVFNRVQSKQFLHELNSLRILMDSSKLRDLIDQIQALMEQVRDSAHLYLVFVGD
jgi:hypothetical protein